MRIDHVFIDMDGVLADFLGGALRVHRRLDALEYYPPGKWNVAEVIGLSERDFWHAIDYHREDFWSSLGLYAWAREVVSLCESIVPVGQVSLLSSPSHCPYSAAGKLLWVREHFPQFSQRYIFTHNKRLLASPGRLLIDDNDSNCMDWHQAGGVAFLWPQPWNAKHASQDGRMSYLRTYLGLTPEADAA